ncbi:MAG: hypothetical protein ACOC0R_01705, partial [Mariniphaga sp.]
MKHFLSLVAVLFLLWSCGQNQNENEQLQMTITKEHTQNAIDGIAEKHPDISRQEIEKGVYHAASLWRQSDGTEEEFIGFCVDNYIGDDKEKEAVFNKVSEYLESMFGHFNKMTIDLKKNVDLQTGSLHAVDHMFSAYSAGAHFSNDFYNNKIAFLVALNFPFYSTEEKNELGRNWSDLQWAYARMGDVFSSRVPSELIQERAAVSAQSDAYIAEYNIYMGNLLDKNGQSLFPENMVLLSHWNLRDEIKANYANAQNGLQKQEMIYSVMQRIIDQSIPEQVVNSGEYQWNPYENKLLKDGQPAEFNPEPNSRYQQVVNNFNALKAFDAYHPVLNTAIKRSFSGNMQIPQE